jgi:hypothetical protein
MNLTPFRVAMGLSLTLGFSVGACGDGGAGGFGQCIPGSEGCVCSQNACVLGLECLGGFCINTSSETSDSGDGDGDPGDGDGDTGDGDCKAGLTLCDDTCVNLETNPSHCGECGLECDTLCVEAACESVDCSEQPCPGFSYCDLADFLCKPGCSADTQCGANQSCDVSTHDCVCDEDYKACEDECIPAEEACVTTCDDGVLDPGEACDGSNLAGESCVSQGFDLGTLGCLDDCTGFDTSGCGGGACNDGFITGNEVCDGDDLDGQTCVGLGFGAGTLECANNCLSFDTSACATAYCVNNAGTLAYNAPLSVNINVPDAGVVADVDVFLAIDHDFMVDVDAELRHLGTTVDLFALLQSFQVDCHVDMEATLDDSANSSIVNACNNNQMPAVDGTYQPVGNLADFNGDQTSGTWTVYLVDAFSPDNGTATEVCVWLTFQ